MEKETACEMDYEREELERVRERDCEMDGVRDCEKDQDWSKRQYYVREDCSRRVLRM